jgi:hypothetical protein
MVYGFLWGGGGGWVCVYLFQFRLCSTSDGCFDKVAFVNLTLVIISNKTFIKHIQNSKNPKKNPYQPMDLKISRKKIRSPKVLRLLPNVCVFQNENHTLGYGL